MPKASTTYTIKGLITNPEKAPIPNLIIKGVEKIMNANTVVAASSTDNKGAFRLSFSSKALSHGGAVAPDIMLQLYETTDHEEQFIATSSIHIMVSPTTTINMEVEPTNYVPPAEYGRIKAQMTPLLAGKDIATLSHTEVASSCNGTEVNVGWAYCYVQAQKMALETNIDTKYLYALLRGGLAPEVADMLYLGDASKRSILTKAVEKNQIEINGETADEINGLISQLNLLKINYPATNPIIAPINLLDYFERALNYSPLSKAEQYRTYQKAFAAQQDPYRSNFVSGLTEIAAWKKAVLDIMVRQFLFILGQGTFREDFLSNPLLPKNSKWYDFGQFGLSGLRSLHNRNSFTLDNFFSHLSTFSRIISPTSYWLSVLKLELGFAQNPGVQWLSQNPTLDFKYISFEEYIAAYPDRWNSIAKAEEVKAEILRLQEAFFLADYDAIVAKAMLQSTFDSMEKIKTVTFTEFVNAVSPYYRAAYEQEIKDYLIEGGISFDDPDLQYDVQAAEQEKLYSTYVLSTTIPSEYQRIHRKLGQGFDPGAHLDAKETAEYAAFHDLSILQVFFYHHAKIIGKQYNLGAESVFGLLKMGFFHDPATFITAAPNFVRSQLQGARSENYISEAAISEIEDFMSSYTGLSTDQTRATSLPYLSLLETVLIYSGLPITDQANILYELANYLKANLDQMNEDDFAKYESGFWAKSYPSDPTKTNLIPRLRIAYQFIESIAQGTAAKKKLKALNIRRFSELATISNGQWISLLEEQPETLSCEDKLTLLLNENGKALQAINTLLPTAMLVAFLTRHEAFERNAALHYLQQHPDFDFKYQNIKEFIAQHPETLDVYVNSHQLKLELYNIQALMHLCDLNPFLASALMLQGLDTAEKIKKRGASFYLEDELLDQLRGEIFSTFTDIIDESCTSEQMNSILFLSGKEQAGKLSLFSVYQKAKRQTALSVLLFARHSKLFNNISTRAFDTEEQLGRDIPELQTLFGSSDTVKCDHSNSVLSPAAYLIDLLQFLHDRKIKYNVGNIKSLYDYFVERRPDINTLELNEANTNALIPQLSLVNQVLEGAVKRNIREINDYQLSINVRGKDNSYDRLAGATVVAIGGNHLKGFYIGSGITNEFGTTFIDYHTDENRRASQRSGSKIFFRVYYQGRLVKMSEDDFLPQPTDYVNYKYIEVDIERINLYQPEEEFVLQGKVMNTYSGQVAAGITIEAWDKDSKQDDLLGSVLTDEKGKYEIRYDASYFKDHHREKYAKLYFKLYDGNRLLLDTSDQAKLLKQSRLERDFEVLYLPEKEETTHDIIYEYFSKASYPWNLPLNVWKTEMDLLLEAHQSSFRELKSLATPFSAPIDALEVALIYLEMTVQERDHLLQAKDPKTTKEAIRKNYGIKSNKGENIEPFNDEHQTHLGNPYFLLHKSRLQFEQLELLLTFKFINPDQKHIEYRLGAITEGEEEAILTLTDDELNRLYQFCFLARKTKWSFKQLQRVLSLLTTQSIDENVLIELGQLKQLEERAKASMDTILGWCSKIDTKVYGKEVSDYQRLVLRKKEYLSPAFQTLLELNVFQNELNEATQPLLEDHGLHPVYEKDLTALFDLSAADLLQIIQEELGESPLINFNNLCRIFSLSSFCKHFSLCINDYYRLCTLLEIDPLKAPKGNRKFDFKSISDFLANLNLLRSLDFDLDTLTYLLKPAEQADVRDEHLQKLSLLVDKVNASIQELKSGDELEEANAPYAKLIIEQIAHSFKISHSLVNDLYSRFLNHPTKEDEAAMAFLMDFFDTVKSTVEAHKDYNRLLQLLEQAYKCALFVNELDINDEDAIHLLENTELSTWYSPLKFPLGKRRKAATFFYKLKPLLLSALLNREIGTPSLSIFQLLNTVAYNHQKGGKQALYDDELIHQMEVHFGWDSNELRRSLRQVDIHLEDHFSGAWIYHLHTRLKYAAKVGLSGTLYDRLLDQYDIYTSNGVDVLKTALRIKNREKAHQTYEQKIGEQLLEVKRDALLQFMFNTPIMLERNVEIDGQLTDLIQFNNVDDIYEFYFIDPQVSACAKTSPIKQAILAVQLFVQRIMMGLEPGLSLLPEDSEEWKWRKNYRHWEAARKVFLYPENWMEPELRNNKSSLYLNMEDQLLQTVLTPESADQIYKDYVYAFDRLARLEVVAFYREEAKNTYHVFGRTRSMPRVYYYRKFLKGSYWTAWEEVGLDIDSDHLIPLIYKDRLMLFWPILSEDPNEPSDADLSYTPGVTTTPAKIRKSGTLSFAYANYDNAKWSSKKVTEQKEFNLSHIPTPSYSKSDIFFHTGTYGENAIIVARIYHPVDEKVYVKNIATYELSPDYEVKVRANTFYTAGGKTSKINKYRYIHEANVQNGRFSGKAHELADKRIRSRILSTTSTVNTDTVNKPNWTYWNHRTFGDTLFEPKDNITFNLIYGNASLSYFFEDETSRRTFLFHESSNANSSDKFIPFYHPFSSSITSILEKNGISGLLAPRNNSWGINRQLLSFDFNFATTYSPIFQGDYPLEEFDFSHGGAYSEYNWELFFHVPLAIGLQLSRNRNFEAAQKWFHYIFDPTLSDNKNNSFWRIKPLYEYSGETSIQALLRNGDISDQLTDWEEDPFNPYAIARHRIPAYMKMIVFKYLENLISWGDHLFSRDSMESINEATQVYTLASQILGRRPQELSPISRPSHSVRDVFSDAGVFSNTLVELNATFPGIDLEEYQLVDQIALDALDSLSSPFFCIPKNNQLLSYWDIVEDRLFKIRHCMNIEGIKRQLALFEPPIDPAVLVRARALGLSDNIIFNNLTAPAPLYRFSYLFQKAIELCNEVKNLGAALLAALEKKDGEELSQLRATHEISLLKTIRKAKENSITEGYENKESILRNKELVQFRRDYYQNLSEEFMNPKEKLQLSKMRKSIFLQRVGMDFDLLGTIYSILPSVRAGANGAGGTPEFTVEMGGVQLSSLAQFNSRRKNTQASIESMEGSIAGIKAGYDRRRDDWNFQTGLAGKELSQLNHQEKMADIRIEILEAELSAHDKQFQHNHEQKAFLSSKFSNDRLYNWMSVQLAKTYQSSYQMAFKMAKMAEKCYENELGTIESNFIEYGYWDNLKEGLLSGEKLLHELRRMEMAYLENNKRTAELNKHIPLSSLDPSALIRLKENGNCYFSIPEVLFDLDHPGHYMRRLKSVSITIPCISGPYTNISSKLTMIDNRSRTNSDLEGNYEDKTKVDFDGTIIEEDPRFTYDYSQRSIATSSAQNDSGLFELNFRDERYLPFEGTGAISSWQLEFPDTHRQFDYNTISDVIIHLSYTAREATKLREPAKQNIKDRLNAIAQDLKAQGEGLTNIFSLKTQFSQQLHQLLHSSDTSATETSLQLTKKHFPHHIAQHSMDAQQLSVLIKLKTAVQSDIKKLSLKLGKKDVLINASPIEVLNEVPSLLSSQPIDLSGEANDVWVIRFEGNALKNFDDDHIDDILLVMHYKLS